MNRILLFLLFILSFTVALWATEPFRFALLTDLHISILKPQHAEDLQLVVVDVNTNAKIDFVLIDGDDSDKGDLESLQAAKKILDKLRVPYYITSGNHDTNNGKITLDNFLQVFGHDTFSFDHKGFYFVGFPTVPVSGGSLGHIAAGDLNFIKTELQHITNQHPVFLVTHYPLLEGDVDNRGDLIQLFPDYNIVAVLNGHYHRNALFSYNGVPGIVNRSTLRGDKPVGGYSIYTVSDSLKVAEKIIGQPEREWLSISLRNNDL